MFEWSPPPLSRLLVVVHEVTRTKSQPSPKARTSRVHIAYALSVDLLAAVLLSIDPLFEAQRAKAARLAERRPTASEPEALLHRLGLDAEPLAVEGVEPDQVDGIVRQLVEALADEDRSVDTNDW